MPPPSPPSPPPPPPLAPGQLVLPGAGTLQAALNAASAGDELVLADGTYTGVGTSDRGDNMLYINKDITIRALNSGQAVLDGQNARRVIYIRSGTVVLDALSITNGRAAAWFEDRGGGVYVAGDGTVMIRKSDIHNNQAVHRGGGIQVDSGTVRLASCQFYSNTAREGPNVYVDGGSVCTFGTQLTYGCCYEHKVFSDGRVEDSTDARVNVTGALQSQPSSILV